MDGYLVKFKLFSFIIRIHWSTLLILIYHFIAIRSFIILPFTLTAYIILILFHELGHVFFIKKYKYYVESIDIDFTGGECKSEQFQYEYEQIIVSWGGVLFQFIIFISSIASIKIFNSFNIASSNIFFITVVYVFIILNFFLIILNLLPKKGLDGYYAWRIFKYIFKRTGNNHKVRIIKKNEMKILSNEEVKIIAEKVITNVIKNAKSKLPK